jgi:hypothetical protein
MIKKNVKNLTCGFVRLSLRFIVAAAVYLLAAVRMVSNNAYNPSSGFQIYRSKQMLKSVKLSNVGNVKKK